MLRTGDQYRNSLRDGREVWINGKKVEDVPNHPAFKPIVDIRARIYDMAHEEKFSDKLTYTDEKTEEKNCVGSKLPKSKNDWLIKREAIKIIMYEVGAVVTRIGDETAGEMWSLYDGTDILNEMDPRFGDNIANHIQKVLKSDTFHVSANTDPKGDRSKLPQDQDPDMLLHAVEETDKGIVVRGAKYETAASYANQAFVKPTIANWGEQKLSNYALGFICPMNAPGLKHICRSGFAGRSSPEDYPLSNRADEIDTLLVFDNVLIPWEDVLFYQHTKAATFIRATLHRYSAHAFIERILHMADLMIGTALHNIRQTGLEHQQAVREKIATLICYREGIDAHLTAAIANAEKSPAGLLMPNQSFLYTGRVHACSQLHKRWKMQGGLGGGKIGVRPDKVEDGRGQRRNSSKAVTPKAVSGWKKKNNVTILIQLLTPHV